MRTSLDRVAVVRIAAGGEFGGEVAGHLAALLEHAGRSAAVVPEPPTDELAGTASGAEVWVRASWRDVLVESNDFAAASLAAGHAFLPVAFAHPYVRVGPAIVPGLAPCHECYSARVRQHATALGRSNTANEEYEQALRAAPRLGVTGYPPHIAAVAAGLAAAMLGSADDHRPRVGWVARIDCGTDAIERWRLSPIDGCPVCGPGSGADGRAKARRERLRALARPPVAVLSGEAR